jgi:PAS domain S-box-containing protein
MIALDETGRAIQVNDTFEAHFGPLFKYAAVTFSSLATDSQEHRAKLEDVMEKAGSSFKARTIEMVKLEDALEKAGLGAKAAGTGTGAPKGTPNGSEKQQQQPGSSFKARNIEMLTLAEGLPIKKHFDWTAGIGRDGQVILFGDPVNEQDEEQRVKDAELVDFFQNAPIALHWLSGEGIVLWANQTELDVLGYTPEEYIGQPIMNFCPDEQELVLEIFKTLGSGNTIKDVPVRFRTKDGRIVNLLIDSNVKYDKAGNFSHTRCFIRDDTTRKIREARASLLLQETKRSLDMLDQFMSRSLHHLRTPLHVLQTTCDLVLGNLKQIQQPQPCDDGNHDMTTTTTEKASVLQESVTLIEDATGHIASAVVLIDDISDLARLDRGVDFEIRKEVITLGDLGKSAVESVEVKKDVTVSFAAKGGPACLHSDAKVVKKVLRHLLDHSVQVTECGSVTLMIGQEDNRCAFAVVISEPGAIVANESGAVVVQMDTKLPAIFQRYHQVLLPEETLDFEEATNLRDTIEQGVGSLKQTCIGIGLSLSYHLVQALGGDLRYSSQPGLTKFWFSLPQENHTALPSEPASIHEKISSSDMMIVKEQPIAPVPGPKNGIAGSGQDDEMDMDTKIAKEQQIMPVPIPIKEDMKIAQEQPILPVPVPIKEVAVNGLKALDRPLVLVVEDTAMCAKLLCMTLRKANCSTTWVDNGQKAVDLLRESTPGMYSFVLMDLRMPVMDGLTATAIIKNELKIDIPVIALTGDTSPDVKRQCEEIGFTEFCGKPLKREQLMAIIQKYTGQNEKAKEEPIAPVPAQDGKISSSDMMLFKEQPIATVPASKKRAWSGQNEVEDKHIKFLKERSIMQVPILMKDVACNGLKALDRPSILVVEDTAMCAKLLCMTLRKALCSATWVDNGQKAVDLLRESTPGMYSLVLMDLRMPVMDGLTATAIIKNELKIDIPVIALTGDTGPDVKRQCDEIGFDEFCGKPLKRDQLLAIIQKYTGYHCCVGPPAGGKVGGLAGGLVGPPVTGVTT